MTPIQLQQLVQQANQSANAAAAIARQAIQEAQKSGSLLPSILAQLNERKQQSEDLRDALKAVQLSKNFGGPPNLQYIENIPGRRIPFDYIVDINIGANTASVQQGTITIDQSGPFVAVARYATFLSAYEFQRKDPTSGATVAFQGRSNGRYRPIHSAWDLNDGLPRSEAMQAVAFPGTGAPHILSPSNGSPFRTMQPDFRIKVLNAGSSFPRSNIEVPSTFWTTQINSAFELGALDVFERGEMIQFNVLPLHVNNPSFGNINGFGAPDASFPFPGSGFDYIEGINDQDDAAAGTTDPITRLPNGILTIGFHGYRIIQPAGSGPY